MHLNLLAVLGNRKEAPVFEKAKKFGIEGFAYQGEAELLAKLKTYAPELIILAGFDRILSAAFIDHFRDGQGRSKIINIHPSLLPSFKGLHAYQLAFDAKVKVTGVTVHRVEPELDAGPILGQKAFSIESCESAEAVEKIGLKIEHELYPEVLEKLIQGVV